MLICFFTLEGTASTYVVIGDSHSCGTFGSQLLANRFGRPGNPNSVTLYCAVSSAPTHWLNGKAPKDIVCKTATSAAPGLKDCSTPGGAMPTAAQIIAQHPGAEIIIALGTNSLMSSVVPASYKQLADLVKQNHHSCFWIAPPHLNPAQSKGFPAGRLEILENNLNTFYVDLYTEVRASCGLIDSRPATREGAVGFQTTDGVHRTPQAGVYWANEITKFFTWF